jgi:hypothetical protein
MEGDLNLSQALGGLRIANQIAITIAMYISAVD